MPAPKKQAPVERDDAMCDNHPGRTAVHTTGSSLHLPISLCEECLRRVPHLRDR